MLFRSVVIPLAIIIACLVLWIGIGLRILRRYLHFPAPAITGYFLSSRLRKMVQPPAAVIRRSGIRGGMDVLEIGCGSGAFTTHAAEEVLPGRVFALDIQPKMLAQFKRRLGRQEQRHLTNIRLIQGSAHDLPFQDGSLDLVFVVTVLMEIPQRSRALQEMRRVLKPQGVLAVTEFLPDPDYPLKNTCIRIVTAEGFNLQEISGGLWNYTIRFSSG